jgi:DHA1 family multidrug resistance protein-like MFS transporter
LSFVLLLVSQLIATMGFTFVMPFTPLYVQELGVEDAGRAAAWAGFVNGATGLTMALAAPLWGLLADRTGRKLMLLRATLAGSVVVGLMGFVAAPWQLLVLRLLQGTLTGTVPAATALVASDSPSRSVGTRLGAFQMIVFVAAAAGPVAGGIFAELVGIRTSFFLTSALLATSGVLVLLGVSEVRSPRKKEDLGDGGVGEKEDREDEGAAPLPAPLPASLPYKRMMPGLVALFLAHVSITSVAVSLPGFLSSIEGAGESLVSLTGQIIGTAALTAALGSVLAGRLADRFAAGRVVVWSLLLAGLTVIPQAWAAGVPELWVLRLATGAFLGAAIPAANIVIKGAVSPERQGAAFGVASSAVAAGFAVGPVGGGLLASTLGFSAAFLVPGVLLLAAGATLWAMRPRPRTGIRAVRRTVAAQLARLH